jgi:hypothetical protein
LAFTYEEREALIRSKNPAWLYLLALVLPLTSGCIGAQLKFRTVIDKTSPGAGGWQETCLEANVQNMTTGDIYLCSVGIGMPIETGANGYIAPWYAAEIAADCVNEAAERAIRPAPPSTPAALACMDFKNQLSAILNKAVYGSRVNLGCNPGIPVTRVNF